MPPVPCKTKEELLRARNKAAAEYSELSLTLSSQQRLVPGDDYSLLEQIVEEARVNAERARLEYEKHITEHGC